MVGSDYNFDLTSTLRGKSEVTLVLKTLESSWSPATFDSKEGEKGPMLIVGYDMPSSPLNASFIVIAGIGIAVVAVVGVFIFRQRQKKNVGKQKQTPPSTPCPNRTKATPNSALITAFPT